MQLNVKCADSRIPGFNVTCQPDWFVSDLKEHISLVCSVNPAPSDQKLIHAGKLLGEDVKIASLFKNVSAVQLLCSDLIVARRIPNCSSCLSLDWSSKTLRIVS